MEKVGASFRLAARPQGVSSDNFLLIIDFLLILDRVRLLLATDERRYKRHVAMEIENAE